MPTSRLQSTIAAGNLFDRATTGISGLFKDLDTRKRADTEAAFESKILNAANQEDLTNLQTEFNQNRFGLDTTYLDERKAQARFGARGIELQNNAINKLKRANELTRETNTQGNLAEKAEISKLKETLNAQLSTISDPTERQNIINQADPRIRDDATQTFLNRLTTGKVIGDLREDISITEESRTNEGLADQIEAARNNPNTSPEELAQTVQNISPKVQSILNSRKTKRDKSELTRLQAGDALNNRLTGIEKEQLPQRTFEILEATKVGNNNQWNPDTAIAQLQAEHGYSYTDAFNAVQSQLIQQDEVAARALNKQMAPYVKFEESFARTLDTLTDGKPEANRALDLIQFAHSNPELSKHLNSFPAGRRALKSFDKDMQQAVKSEGFKKLITLGTTQTSYEFDNDVPLVNEVQKWLDTNDVVVNGSTPKPSTSVTPSIPINRTSPLETGISDFDGLSTPLQRSVEALKGKEKTTVTKIQNSINQLSSDRQLSNNQKLNQLINRSGTTAQKNKRYTQLQKAIDNLK